MGQELSDIQMPSQLEDEEDDGNLDMELEMDEALPADLVEYARTRVGETDDSVKLLAIDELRELVYQRGDITPLRMDDDYLVRFLRARNYKMDSAYRVLQNYCQFREDNMNYYNGVNPMELLHVGDSNILSVLPYRDQEGRRILIFNIGNWTPSECPLDDILKVAVGILEAGILEPRTQILGGVAIMDMGGLTLSHALYFTPTMVNKILQIIMTSFPMKIASIHIVNESWMFERVFSLFKPFIGSRYEETVHFHGTDLDSLHRYVEPNYLPKQYGGTRPDYGYLKWFLNISKDERVVKAMDELGYELKFKEKLEEKLKSKLDENKKNATETI